MNYRFPVRVYYEDTDAAGIVYYANYFRFMERARTEWLRELGFEQDEVRQQHGVVFVVRSATANYRAPAKFNDLLWVTVGMNQHSRTAMTIEQNIYRQKDDRLLCKGEISIVCVDSDSFRPRPIPAAILEKIKNAE
ncbi:MAG TPA: tol-pal system-associated acyl-CoA thioesterase [Thiolapillus brandeum]|uniref:Tol-pal system-associated acyl-CoA thioesterase n=1 Tax=Thiolapillus brandeum TaxID=1076588 RepID=A0A831KCB0_9GAMM|nr:tol-pal system-associated acyl-CoA thioesterase [Thiolapillus brandeum]